MNLIPAGDRENFVLRIWNHYERCDSVRTSCLILFGAQTFLGVVSIVSSFPVIHFTRECFRSGLKYSAMAVISQDNHLTFGPRAACCVLSTLFAIVLERSKLALFCIISETKVFCLKMPPPSININSCISQHLRDAMAAVSMKRWNNLSWFQQNFVKWVFESL